MSNGGSASIVDHFRAGLEILKQYPVMVVPPLAAQAIVFVLALLFVGGAATAVALGGGAGLAGAFLGAFVLAMVGALLSLVSSAVTILMARDALAGREPAIGDALGAVTARLGDVVIASVLVTVIVSFGLLLLVVPGLIAGFFLVFTLPAVLLDGRGSVEALKQSASLVLANVGAVVGLVIGVIVAGVAVMIVSAILGRVPILGQLVSAVLGGLFLAYLTVVAVRLYQALPRR
jgi:uncharacterized protein involved in cysteine biosynthesis